jgi:hypothetical protein
MSLHQIGLIRLELQEYEKERSSLRKAATLLEQLRNPGLPVTLALLRDAQEHCAR